MLEFPGPDLCRCSIPSPSLHTPIEHLAGSVERVTFHSQETGFCVLRVKVRGHRDLVTVVGTAATITPGEDIESTGCWVTDRTHGLHHRVHAPRTHRDRAGVVNCTVKCHFQMATSTRSPGATLVGTVVEHAPHLVARSLPVRSSFLGPCGSLHVSERSRVLRHRRVWYGCCRSPPSVPTCRHPLTRCPRERPRVWAGRMGACGQQPSAAQVA